MASINSPFFFARSSFRAPWVKRNLLCMFVPSLLAVPCPVQSLSPQLYAAEYVGFHSQEKSFVFKSPLLAGLVASGVAAGAVGVPRPLEKS